MAKTTKLLHVYICMAPLFQGAEATEEIVRLFALFRVIPDWFVSSLLAHTSAHTGSIKDHTFFKPLRTLKHALGGSKRVVYGSPGHIFWLA